jgi:hypothetical protein
VGFEVVAQRGGLLPAEVGEGRVREDVVGSFGGVGTTRGLRTVVEGRRGLRSTLWTAWAWRMRTRVGGMERNDGLGRSGFRVFRFRFAWCFQSVLQY